MKIITYLIAILSIQTLVANPPEDLQSWPALHYALETEDLQNAKRILLEHPEQAAMLTPDVTLWRAHLGNDAVDDYDYPLGTEKGRSALEIAIRHQMTDIIEDLIANGADVNFARLENDGRWGILEDAYNFEKGKFALFHYGSNYTITTPLYWALESKNPLLLEKILTYKPSFKSIYHRSKGTIVRFEPDFHEILNAFQYAIKHNDDDTLRMLIGSQAKRQSEITESDLELFKKYAFNEKKWPILHSAIDSNESLDVLKRLLDLGENTLDKGNCPKSSFNLAFGNWPVFNLLAQYTPGAEQWWDFEQLNQDQCLSLLMQFVGKRKYDLTEALIGHFYDIEVLKLAILMRDPKMVQIIAGIKIYDDVSLDYSIEIGDPIITEILINLGFTPKDKLKAYHYALERKNHAMVNLLRKYKYNVRYVNG